MSEEAVPGDDQKLSKKYLFVFYFLIQAHLSMLASRVSVGGRSFRFCCSSSFHSALKRQLKADKKAKEKEKKLQVEPASKVMI